MVAIDDVWEYYGLQHQFTLSTLPTFDILHRTEHFLAKFPPLLFRAGQRFTFNLLMATYNRSALKYLHHHTADVYYLRDKQVLWALIRARPDLAPRIVYEVHDFPKAKAGQKKALIALPQIAGIIAVTHHLKTLYTQAGGPPERILVAPDGVNLRQFERVTMTQQEARTYLKLPMERFVVGYVGRLHTLGKEKGISHLIEAIAILRQSSPSPGATLCCVGGPEEMAMRYQELASQLGLAPDEVIFVPQVPPAEVPLYLRAFDLCAMPFPWTQHYAYYMSPLKMFEYMAAQRPIIATKLPSVQEILRHGNNAYLVPPDDPQALAEGICWLATHPDAAQSIAKQARADVQQYTWSERARRALKFVAPSLVPDLGKVPNLSYE